MRNEIKIEAIQELFESHDLRPTHQRLRILGYLHDHPGEHPTAEDIHAALLGEMPTLALATVYNTLGALQKKGLVSGVSITGSEMRYHYVTNFHHHLLCRKCGKILDLDVGCAFATGKRKSFKGHQIEEVHGYFKGICEACTGKTRPCKGSDVRTGAKRVTGRSRG
ncbi:Fur family transcriptional regulator [Candidatus Eisenbacteria bacterium]|uniref:Fur family transcriptional regulator n=1 Tax=Eiseniibacteriota bacterium TaxID=2212470 RepID=A0ABV6YPN9_UNCEI